MDLKKAAHKDMIYMICVAMWMIVLVLVTTISTVYPFGFFPVLSVVTIIGLAVYGTYVSVDTVRIIDHLNDPSIQENESLFNGDVVMKDISTRISRDKTFLAANIDSNQTETEFWKHLESLLNKNGDVTKYTAKNIENRYKRFVAMGSESDLYAVRDIDPLSATAPLFQPQRPQVKYFAS